MNGPQNPYLCDECAATLPVNTTPVTYKDAKAAQYFNRGFAAFEYGQPIVNLILKLKYSAEGDTALAVAPFMAAAYLHHNKSVPNDAVLVPVPLSKKRERQREYNQALLLAKELSPILGLAVADKALIRTKATEAQKHMTVAQRAANLKNAFAIARVEDVLGKYIILVDDVFTSGATANECARVLREAGAHSVDVLTIAAVC